MDLDLPYTYKYASNLQHLIYYNNYLTNRAQYIYFQYLLAVLLLGPIPFLINMSYWTITLVQFVLYTVEPPHPTYDFIGKYFICLIQVEFLYNCFAKFRVVFFFQKCSGKINVITKFRFVGQLYLILGEISRIYVLFIYTLMYGTEIIIRDRFAKISRRLASVIEWEGDMTKFLIFVCDIFHLQICTFNFICIIVKKKSTIKVRKNSFCLLKF